MQDHTDFDEKYQNLKPFTIIQLFNINNYFYFSRNDETYKRYIKIYHNVLTTAKVLIARLLCAGGTKEFALDNVVIVPRKKYDIP